ncbi:MAG: hypothetical protein COW16_06625 [Sphingomonadales bacterium CG12_big_fil_rev_8_21_14_0_65_65_10]|jgi:hypothetical protein|uniref:Uncharacterized protein n=1 Tax=Blastomonas marina TaxID=1867408 RepID=A0ABQ1FCK9_9SPHN|nr:hypothetical protein [Blastomonas marina]PIW55350.1 MAG: hypothetical protein COW16_06625 [Sphingomonadales bacterium CG12_big_fil_rev_8_21_14_0_65_65_10]GGA07027.1 hypothetical protein GCM10010923_16260 [Blastomonas marina]
MDLNHQYAEHQRALMGAGRTANEDERLAKLATASRIAGRISDFQIRLGAAAACAWSKAQFADHALIKTDSQAIL